MSKVSKILISLSFAFIVAFSFMFANLQPLFAKADTISNYNVSFIAPDNSILYSTGSYIPSGSSLNDIESSNLVDNGGFVGLNGSYSRGSVIFTDSNGTFKTWLYNPVVINQDYTFLSTTNGEVLQYVFSSTNYNDVVISASFYVSTDNVNYSICSYSVKPSIHGTGYFDWGNIQINVNGSGFAFVSLYLNSNSSLYLKYFKIEVGSSFTGFYDSQYVYNKLTAYDFSNYYYQYDIDTSIAIISDKYFYPNKVVSNVSSDWVVKKWGVSNYGYINIGTIWTDGNNYYCSNGNVQLVLDISTSNWVTQYWNGLTNFTGMYVWSDGINYYYSDGSFQYVLNTLTSTWTQKTWNGLTNFTGLYVWSDGINYYYSDGSSQYVLDISTSTWTQKTWNGLTNFTSMYVWSDGTNYYYSGGSSSSQYVLDISTSTWTQKTWNGLGYFQGAWIWTDGSNYYYSNGSSQYVLDSFTSTWSQKIWSGDLTYFSGTNIWYSDFGIFYSYGNQQYVFGSSLLPLDSTYYYNNGYDTGYDNGYNNGYDTGYNKGYVFGVEEAGNYTFFSLISAVMDAPLKVFYGLFNFELMGVNLAGFIQALLSLAILLFIIRFALQK